VRGGKENKKTDKRCRRTEGKKERRKDHSRVKRKDGRTDGMKKGPLKDEDKVGRERRTKIRRRNEGRDIISKEGRQEGRTEGMTEGRMEGRTEGGTDGWTEGRKETFHAKQARRENNCKKKC